jgi:hypothetical protein
MKQVSHLYSAQAPSHYTFGSHSAMFSGFTPGIASKKRRFLNPKYGRLFRLSTGEKTGYGAPGFTLAGRNIVHGFANEGYRTIGTGAMQWFNPETEVSQMLISGFSDYVFGSRGRGGPAFQMNWVAERLAEGSEKVFVFVNIGVTHVPYHFDGAPWPRDDNPCVPFQTVDRSADCRLRQRACAEYADRLLAPLLDAFRDATILLCGDHGDCWGEDGLWEHGISHPMTLTVPLLIRYRGTPVERFER